MKLSLFLPWFPILLAVGVSGRLLGRQRGYAFGVLCALFWIVLVQSQSGGSAWSDSGQLLSLFAGCAALIAMGGWAGEFSPGAARPAGSEAGTDALKTMPGRLAGAYRMFDEWQCDHRDDADPWPAFGEFVRMMLHQTCGATHVRLFRVTADGESLEPMHVQHARAPVPAADSVSRLTGTDEAVRPGNREHEPATTTEWSTDDALPGRTSWRFAVRHGGEPLGIVQVGQVDTALLHPHGYSECMAQLTSLFWGHVAANIRLRTAETEDPVSGLLTRHAFLRAAAGSLRDSYANNEPVAVAVIALERLRELNDAGRWETADELVHEAAAALRLKARTEDCLGRFDGSRFVVLFRRVDARLAALIVAQVMARLNSLCGDATRWKANITARCGVVGSGLLTPDLRTLLSGALSECHRARGDQRSIASGLEVIRTHEEAGAPQ